MLAAPLLSGNDLRDMSNDYKMILTNKEVIALDQDSLGRQATCYRDNGDYQIWVKQLKDNEKAVCLLNKSDEKKTVQVDFNLLSQIRGMGRFGGPQLKLADYRVRDLWEHKDLTMKEAIVYMDLLPHTVKVFRFIKK